MLPFYCDIQNHYEIPLQVFIKLFDHQNSIHCNLATTSKRKL